MKWYHALIIGLQVASLVTTVEGGLVGWILILLLVASASFWAYRTNKLIESEGR